VENFQLDRCYGISDNWGMSTTTDTKDELEDAIAALMKEDRDFEDIRRAGDELDRLREETRKRVGTLDVAVELIRDARK